MSTKNTAPRGFLSRIASLFSRKAAPSRGRAYSAGAQYNRLNGDWILSASSPDQEVRADLRELRRRARALVRDNAYARQFIRTLALNVCGPQGITMHPRNVGADRGPASKANAALKAAWLDWSHAETASVDGRMSWPEMQRQIIAAVATDGEAFIRLWDGFRNDYGFALELIDPDLVDEQFNREADQQGNAIRMGVEVDRFHRPVAYHVWSRHPNEPGPRERLRIPAGEVVHLFRPTRIGQTRGPSWFASVILDLKMLGGYQEAELVAARTAAAKMGFFQVDPEHADGYEPVRAGERLTMDATPGAAEMLPPGVTFQEWSPEHPSGTFAPFVKSILRSYAMGMGTAYHTVSGDLEGVNYSSARIGTLDEREEWRTLQTWMAEHCHRPVFRAWLRVALLTPKLSLPSSDPARWADVEWRGRGWKWVDPNNEAQAFERRLRLGLTSRTRECVETGADLEQNLEDLAREQTLADALDLDIDGVDAAPAPAAADQSETPNQEDKPGAKALRVA